MAMAEMGGSFYPGREAGGVGDVYIDGRVAGKLIVGKGTRRRQSKVSAGGVRGRT
jgi:hypothetical protein